MRRNNNSKKNLITYNNCSDLENVKYVIINAPNGVCASAGSNSYSIYVIYSECLTSSPTLSLTIILPVVAAIVVFIIIVIIIIFKVKKVNEAVFPHKNKTEQRNQIKEKKKEEEKESSEKKKSSKSGSGTSTSS